MCRRRRFFRDTQLCADYASCSDRKRPRPRSNGGWARTVTGQLHALPRLYTPRATHTAGAGDAQCGIRQKTQDVGRRRISVAKNVPDHDTPERTVRAGDEGAAITGSSGRALHAGPASTQRRRGTGLLREGTTTCRGAGVVPWRLEGWAPTGAGDDTGKTTKHASVRDSGRPRRAAEIAHSK